MNLSKMTATDIWKLLDDPFRLERWIEERDEFCHQSRQEEEDCPWPLTHGGVTWIYDEDECRMMYESGCEPE